MRALFEDVPNNTGAVSFSGVVIQEVGFPSAYPTNRRDLWFRFSRYSAEKILCRAYTARCADDVPYVASVTSPYVSIGPSAQTLTLARSGAQTPILTGLQVVGMFSQEIAGSNEYWWGYTAAPDLVVADNIVTLLSTRIGAGQALYGIGTNIYTGDETEAEAMPLIAVVPQPVEMDLSSNTGSTMQMVCPVEIHVAVDMLAEPRTAWRKCREYMAAIESILHDENRTSYGECHHMYRRDSQGPGPANGKPTVMVGVVRMVAVFPNVWRDDAYPRS